MVAVVCEGGRHSDQVSNYMYTARLRCAQFRKCVMEITTEGGKIEKQGVCVCVKSRVDSGSQRSGNASACSELQSDWVRAVGQRGLVERGPESLGRRNTLNAKARPGKALLYRDIKEAAGSLYVHGNKTRNGTCSRLGCLWFPFGRRLYSRDASLSAGTGVFSNKPGKEDRMQGTYSSDVCGLPGNCSPTRRASVAQAFAVQRISRPQKSDDRRRT